MREEQANYFEESSPYLCQILPFNFQRKFNLSSLPLHHVQVHKNINSNIWEKPCNAQLHTFSRSKIGM